MDYVSLAVRTENKDFEGIRARMADDSIRLLHGVMGIGTEVGELAESTNSSNLKEECGDLAWYIALCCDVLGISLEEMEKAHVPSGFKESTVFCNMVAVYTLSARVGMGLDLVKKNVFYGKPLDKEKMKLVIQGIVSIVMELCATNHIDYEDMKAKNIAKLQARYPNKFTEADAVQRDLDKEKKALGG